MHLAFIPARNRRGQVSQRLSQPGSFLISLCIPPPCQHQLGARPTKTHSPRRLAQRSSAQLDGKAFPQLADQQRYGPTSLQVAVVRRRLAGLRLHDGRQVSLSQCPATARGIVQPRQPTITIGFQPVANRGRVVPTDSQVLGGEQPFIDNSPKWASSDARPTA